jgi:hypothetical protein
MYNLQEAYLEVYYELDEIYDPVITRHNENVKRWNADNKWRDHNENRRRARLGDPPQKTEHIPHAHNPDRTEDRPYHEGERFNTRRSDYTRWGDKNASPHDKHNYRNRDSFSMTLDAEKQLKSADEAEKTRRSKEPVHPLDRAKKPKTQSEQLDLYDVILDYLLDEGYTDTIEGAEAIMVSMSEDWIDDICEEVLDEGFKRMNRSKIERQANRLGGDRGDTLRTLSKRMDTPDERAFSTRESRRNKLSKGAGTFRNRMRELQAKDDAKDDIEKYGFH